LWPQIRINNEIIVVFNDVLEKLICIS